MILGVGVDLLARSDLSDTCIQADDPFLVKSYTKNEIGSAEMRDDPAAFYATRFAGKEAVFKSLGISSNKIKLNEIEILNNDNGQPEVRLYGKIKEEAMQKEITKILISLSYDNGYAMAFAVTSGD